MKWVRFHFEMFNFTARKLRKKNYQTLYFHTYSAIIMAKPSVIDLFSFCRFVHDKLWKRKLFPGLQKPLPSEVWDFAIRIEDFELNARITW